MNKQLIGEVVQIVGASLLIAAAILTLKHWPVALCIVVGGVAFYVGKRIREGAKL